MINRLKRIAFAKDHMHKPLEFWETVIFSDESKFCIFGIKGRKLIWRKSCTALQKEHLVPTGASKIMEQTLRGGRACEGLLGPHFENENK
ncbi:transposable element Tc1 transposase [Trichonephila clavipes]|nr:transposable element Tc1 transposase [Trichonephila clavipes]